MMGVSVKRMVARLSMCDQYEPINIDDDDEDDSDGDSDGDGDGGGDYGH